jgi:hypothetical protein
MQHFPVPVLLSDGLFIAIVYINASLSYRYHPNAQEPQVQLVKAGRISFTCSILIQATNPVFMEKLQCPQINSEYGDME